MVQPDHDQNLNLTMTKIHPDHDQNLNLTMTKIQHRIAPRSVEWLLSNQITCLSCLISPNLLPENIFLFTIGSKMRCDFTERRRREVELMSESDVLEVISSERK